MLARRRTSRAVRYVVLVRRPTDPDGYPEWELVAGLRSRRDAIRIAASWIEGSGGAVSVRIDRTVRLWTKPDPPTTRRVDPTDEHGIGLR